MGMLEMLLGDAGLERTITIKTKPQKEQAPEAPLDPNSANLPQPVMELMGMMGNGQMNGQIPMQWGDPQAAMLQQQMQQQQMQQIPNLYQA